MQEKSPIKQNILKYLDFKGITKYKFYQETGITRGILEQNNGISEENISKFLVYYTDINLNWLFLGQGSMLLTSEPTSEPHQKRELHKEVVSEELKEYIKMLEQCQKRYAQLMDRVEYKDKQIEKLQGELDKSKRTTNV